MSSSVKVAEDHSKYYVKTPQEMSRHEIAELERELRALNDPEGSDAEGNASDGEAAGK